MKKTILLSTLFVAGVVSAFPFRTSCGKILQVSQTIANHMTQNQLSSYLSDLNSEACPQHANSTLVTVTYTH
ncbi:hypothetical protein CLU96_3672 [Chryseobacterium sp. 52]|uniref:hypothetical protein n=1 Tax=Chryseobacterium sp. 52 TaxID=2035213 RepID=UPI000C595E86|nr:hypothetical protein [Chryseobacterium sp. 52]PIF46634.1 hypothetical protein CLU96_3672 [Chryseobacterium sp. 52]